jgi:hypothetical protein
MINICFEGVVGKFEPFSKENNLFVSVFFKILKGEANEKEIEFAKDYSKGYILQAL